MIQLIIGIIAVVFVASTCRAESPGFQLIQPTPTMPSQYCGVDSLFACMRMIRRADIKLNTLDQQCSVGAHGVSMQALRDAAERNSIESTAVQLTHAQLLKLEVPAVLHVNNVHFIAVIGHHDDQLIVYDNNIGLCECSMTWFQQRYSWDGSALVVGTSRVTFGPTPVSWAILTVGFGLFLVAVSQRIPWRQRMKRLSAPSDVGPLHVRPAMTLLEVVVVIAIVGVVLALLLPAVGAARRAAARIACRDHLRQIGLGFQNYHSAHGVFPNNGGGSDATIPDIYGELFQVQSSYNYPPINQVTYLLGVGDPALGPGAQPGSWAFSLLPYMDQDNVYRSRGWTAGVPVYACPARRSSSPQVAHDDEFGWYKGGGWAWGKTDYAVNRKLIRGSPAVIAIPQIGKGSSNTILVGEKALDPRLYTSGSWFHDEPFFLGNSPGSYRDESAIVRDQSSIEVIGKWGSAHSGTANFLFADGSVRPLTYGLSTATVSVLMSPR